MESWEWVAVLAGGMFTAVVVYVAAVQGPRWRGMEIPIFLPQFARAINVADKVQPMLLVVTLVSSVIASRSLDGTSNVLAWAAAAGFALTLVGSVSFLVPLQRRMIRLGPDPALPLDEMRARWLKGHLGRASLAVMSFALLLFAMVGTA
jgi:anthrone oxygenase-like protein